MKALRTPPLPQLSRSAGIDNLKVLLVIGVIVGHATMAWTGVGNWVLTETPIREPLLTALVLLEVVAALFAIPLFFFLAGLFTPASLQRKGTRRFLRDRFLRLGVPMLFFVVFLSPVVEYVDPGWAGWDRGFWAFLPEVWWPPAPGPTWFLGVLLVFSLAYAAVRTLLPVPVARPGATPSLRALAGAVAATAIAAFVARIWVPLGVEAFRLALGQSPSWVLGFGLGIAAAERGWAQPVDLRIAHIAGRAALTASAGVMLLIVALSVLNDADMEPFAGGGTALSLGVAVLEATLIVAMSLWSTSLAERRLGHQGAPAPRMARSAFAAFVVHQVVLVWLVLASRLVEAPPELEYLVVASLAVVFSFGLGSVALRVPGVSKVL